MSNSKNIALFEFLRRLLICSHELAQKVFPIDDFLTGFLPLLQFFERHAGDQRLTRIHAGQELCNWVSPKSKVPLWDLTDDTVIPLHVVDGFYCAFKVAATLQEPELSGESDLS